MQRGPVVALPLPERDEGDSGDTPGEPGTGVPNSLSQDGAAGLGAQAGEARLRTVLDEAGFTQVRRGAHTR